MFGPREAHLTLVGDDEEVLVVDLITFDFTLQHLGCGYLAELRARKERSKHKY